MPALRSAPRHADPNVGATASGAPESSRALLWVSTAVLLAGSTWFSGTAAAPGLSAAWGLSPSEAAWLTTAVQIGFIAGTFLYAAFNVSDVWNARHVFAASALVAALANGVFAAFARSLGPALALRFVTGVSLAGVYPVGMKIVASWYRTGLGWRLGVMVGALVLGTASPYLIQAVGADFEWRTLVALSSGSAVLGALLVLVCLRDGPYLRAAARFDPRVMLAVFRHTPFRRAALGYFGHMWELYALWALVGLWLRERFVTASAPWPASVELVAFACVAAGLPGCVVGGWVSRTQGERAVALFALLASGGLSLFSGLAYALPPVALVAYVVAWGFFVVADSPQFSALAARHCPPEYTGTALTVQNGIGFAVTIVTIQLLPWLAVHVGWRWVFSVLALGPFFGAWSMWRLEEPQGARP